LRNSHPESAIRRWVQTTVVGLNLCPFAKRELDSDRVRFAVTDASTETALLVALESELLHLADDSSLETTMLIHPDVLKSFSDYNQFLDMVDGLLAQMALEGAFQVASFHPEYQFADTDIDDPENYTNRSPYPVLHILREESIERAVAGAPDTDQVPARNIEKMNSIGTEKLRADLASYLVDDN
jgi:hypothetical protein